MRQIVLDQVSEVDFVTSKQDILEYQQKCHRDYKRSVRLLPESYTFPDGNPILALPPIQTRIGGLMIIGAYPSARFESRLSQAGRKSWRLVPIANNLQPFGYEQYFDGLRVRTLESADGLQEYLLSKLPPEFQKCWVTDLVKVFLYKQSHAESCKAVHPEFAVPVFRDRFYELGINSLSWLRQECELCHPKLVVTLGEEVAQVISGEKKALADDLLMREVTGSENLGGYPTLYLPHPDACRRSSKWRERMKKRVSVAKRILAG
jgi:hypothetical protein